MNAIKTVYINKISLFNESVLQNFEIKSADLPKNDPKTVLNDQNIDSNKIYPSKLNSNNFSRKSKILLRSWK